MSDGADTCLALTILAVHLAIIVFNVVGLIAIPVGAWRRWRWVRRRGWRLVHLLVLAVVALQALLGRACFLTVWQAALSGRHGQPMPLIVRWVDRWVYWPLPLWFFAVIYMVVWIYAFLLWRWVPPADRLSANVCAVGWRRPAGRRCRMPTRSSRAAPAAKPRKRRP